MVVFAFIVVLLVFIFVFVLVLVLVLLQVVGYRIEGGKVLVEDVVVL